MAAWLQAFLISCTQLHSFLALSDPNGIQSFVQTEVTCFPSGYFNAMKWTEVSTPYVARNPRSVGQYTKRTEQQPCLQPVVYRQHVLAGPGTRRT